MSGWQRPIRCYVSPAGNDKIADWYEGLSVQEQNDADEFIGTMRKTGNWVMPNYRPSLKGGKGLGELRWYSEKKQHRLIGFFVGETWHAVMGCTHKQQVYSPADALDEAERRKKRIERGEVTTVEYDL